MSDLSVLQVPSISSRFDNS